MSTLIHIANRRRQQQMGAAVPQRPISPGPRALARFGERPAAPPAAESKYGEYPAADADGDVAQVVSAFTAAVDDFKGKLSAINAGLYAAAQDQGGAASQAFQSWHGEAVDWENGAAAVVSQLQQLGRLGILTEAGWQKAKATDASGVIAAQFSDVGDLTPAQKLVSDYVAQGVGVMSDARVARAAIDYDDSLSAAIDEFASALPARLEDALNRLIGGLGRAATNLTWQAVKPFLIAGGAAIALLYGLRTLGGVKADYGPVRFGGRTDGEARAPRARFGGFSPEGKMLLYAGILGIGLYLLVRTKEDEPALLVSTTPSAGVIQ